MCAAKLGNACGLAIKPLQVFKHNQSQDLLSFRTLKQIQACTVSKAP
jgi:hypothetical protein